MIRGPSYDDSYITRKMSHMAGPTFSAPARPPVTGYLQGYHPLAPPTRLVHHRLPPSYYDYDYGYGGYYGYVPPPIRMSRYDPYLDDDLLEPTYIPRYHRPRLSDTLDDAEYREKSVPHTTIPRSTTHHIRSYSPGMLQDHVDNMRIRLKSLAYSLDPTGPVPEIIVPDRPKKSSLPDDKKYSSGLEFTELPKLASRRQRYYPEDQHMKDNLRIQCLSHYKTTRTAADAQLRAVMPESCRYNKYSSSKWEEPDTVFGAPSDKKPFSKAVTDGNTEEASEEKKERRKKKKSRERDIVGEMAAPAPAPAPSDLSLSEIEAVSVPTESEAVPVSTEAAVEEEVLDEKERKRLEKKKRKAEREAAAKAAMEAELAALAAAEAELARLEAESNALKPEAPVPEVVTPVEVVAAPAEAAVPLAEPAAEVKSESAAEKCESSTEVVCEGVCVTPETLGDPAPSEPPLHVPPQEEQESPQVVEHVSRHLTDEPQAIHESVPALEPPLEESQVEPSMEVSPVELPAEESHVELPVEKLQLEAQLGTPVGVPKSEVLLLEPPDQEPHAEESQVEPPVEEPHADESQVEPPVEVPLVETFQVEAQMEAPYAKEPVAVVEEETPVVESTAEEPGMATRRAAAYDEDAGWLDGWVAAGTEETGLHLGTEVSEEPATRTIQAGPDHLTAADADDTSKLEDHHLVQQM